MFANGARQAYPLQLDSGRQAQAARYWRWFPGLTQPRERTYDPVNQ